MLFTAQPTTAEQTLRVVMSIGWSQATASSLAVTELAEAHPFNPELLKRIQAVRRRIYGSADYQESIRSYFERRAPAFRDGETCLPTGPIQV